MNAPRVKPWLNTQKQPMVISVSLTFKYTLALHKFRDI